MATSPDKRRQTTKHTMDASIVALAEYESLHSNVDNSSRAQAKALAVATTNLTVKLAAIQAKKYWT